MGNRILLLVRHGQYHTEKGNTRFGQLTQIGRQQARLSGRRLESLPVDVIHCSTALRAVETADIFAQCLPGVPIRRSRMLLEGIPTSVPGVQVKRATMVADHERMQRAFDRYFRPARGADRHEVMVCHGNLIRFLLRCALEDSPSKWWRFGLSNCGISTVRLGSDKPIEIHGFNDIGHLPLHLQTHN